MLQDPPSTQAACRTESNATDTSPSLNAQGSDKNDAASPKSKFDAVLAKSGLKRAKSWTRQQAHQKSAEDVDLTTSLVDVDEDETDPAAEADILIDDNNGTEVSISNGNKGNTSLLSSPPRTSNVSRVNASGLVSILKGCTECGGGGGAGYDDDDIVVDRKGPAGQSCVANNASPSSVSYRTLCSRVSFSEELSVREVPKMSSEEKSKQFYTASELQSIRRDALDEREITRADSNEDCNLFWEDMYNTFCIDESCTSRACVVDNAFDYGCRAEHNVSDYGRHGGL